MIKTNSDNQADEQLNEEKEDKIEQLDDILSLDDPNEIDNESEDQANNANFSKRLRDLKLDYGSPTKSKGKN